MLLCAGCGAGATPLVVCPADQPIYDPPVGCVAPELTAPAALDYQAVIVTDAAYLDDFAPLAELHTLTGTSTEVVTKQAICAEVAGGCHDDDACNDTAKAIKDYLARRYHAGLRQVVLGGDLTVVPSRQTRDVYANPLLGVSYQRTFYSDHYFADLSAWDGNGDCVYGEPSTDTPDYLPELSVTRIPVASTDEIRRYVDKVLRYLTAYDTHRIGTALFLSNVATELSLPWSATPLPVDSSLYFEAAGRTLSLLPSTFQLTKLYSAGVEQSDAAPMSVSAEIAAFGAGANIVVHAGHGDAGNLTVEQDGSVALSAAMVHELRNNQLPIMLSCACEAADFTGTVASAGRSFVLAPDGGGIGYLGNSTLGLGLAGGMQLIDELLRQAFTSPGITVGEALAAARAHLPRQDAFTVSGLPVVGSLQIPVIDGNAWRWTQKAATYLGDGLVPIYTDISLQPAPALTVTSRRIGNFVRVTLATAGAVPGTLRVSAAGNIYRFALDGTGQVASLTLDGLPQTLRLGFSSPVTLASVETVGL
jgi:hypothetical protein